MADGELSELDSWKMTVAVMSIASLVIFMIQRFIVLFLDPVFEFCIFHLSTVLAVIIFLRKSVSRLGTHARELG